MKKGMLVMLVSVMSMGAFAQNKSLGINAGFSNAWLKNYEDKKFKSAGNAGLSFIYSTKTNFGFGVDLKYSREGGKREAGSLQEVTHLDYIRVPLKVIYFFGKYGQTLRPKISAGPSFAYLIGGETESKVGNVTTTYKAEDYFKRADFGMNLSAGLNYRLKKNTWFTADVNYYNGFNNIRKTGSTPKFANNNLGLNLGVNWGLGK